MLNVSTLRRAGVRSSSVAAILFAAAPALAQIASPVLREGDTIAAGTTVTSLQNVPMSNAQGGYVIGTISSDTVRRWYGTTNGASPSVLLTAGTFGQYTWSAMEGFYGFSNAGQISYSPTVSDSVSGATGLDSVWLNSSKTLNEQDPMPSHPGQFSTLNSDPNFTRSGLQYWVGGWSATQGGSTQNRGLLVGPSATPLLQGGDVVGNSGGATVTNAGGPGFGGRMSANGTHYIVNATLSGSTATDRAIVVDDNIISANGGFVREGTAVTVAGANPGELWSNFDSMGVNENGVPFVTGDTNAATTVDEFVLVGSSFAMREGQSVSTPLGAGTISGDIEWGAMNETQDWAVTWDVQIGANNREALVVNGNVLLVETQLVDWNGDGTVDAGDNNGRLVDFTGIRALSMSEQHNGFFDVFFTADVDFNGTTSTTDDLEGAFRISIAVPEPACISLLALGAVALKRRARVRR